jgi:hypothetical protein
MTTTIARQNAIDVFVNDDGGISILMDDPYRDEQIVWFTVHHADAIIAAIQAAREQIEAGE